MGGSDAITSGQMARFTFIAQTGTGITMLPTILAREVGRDGWISVIITGIIVMIFSAFLVAFLNKYGDKGIIEINNVIFGRTLGTIINIILTVYLIVSAAGLIRVFIFFIRVTLLPATPGIIITPFIIFPSIYMVWKGLKVASRFKAVTMISYFFVLLYIALLIKEMRFSFLLPVGEAGMLKIIYGMRSSYFALVGWELIAFLYPEITDKKKALKWHVNASLFSTVFLSITVVACTAILGTEFLKHQAISLFTVSRILNAPIIERVDLYLVTLWFIAMGCSTRAYFMAAYYSINKAFHIKKSKIIYGAFVTGVILLSFIPGDYNAAYKFYQLINYSAIGLAAYLGVCMVIALFRKKGAVSNET